MVCPSHRGREWPRTVRGPALCSAIALQPRARSTVTVRDILRILEAEGWYLVSTRGSHRQFKHPMKPGRVTIAGHPSDDLAPGTLNSIRKQASLGGER